MDIQCANMLSIRLWSGNLRMERATKIGKSALEIFQMYHRSELKLPRLCAGERNSTSENGEQATEKYLEFVREAKQWRGKQHFTNLCPEGSGWRVEA